MFVCVYSIVLLVVYVRLITLRILLAQFIIYSFSIADFILIKIILFDRNLLQLKEVFHRYFILLSFLCNFILFRPIFVNFKCWWKAKLKSVPSNDYFICNHFLQCMKLLLDHYPLGVLLGWRCPCWTVLYTNWYDDNI